MALENWHEYKKYLVYTTEQDEGFELVAWDIPVVQTTILTLTMSLLEYSVVQRFEPFWNKRKTHFTFALY